jgi:hypothetical protein
MKVSMSLVFGLKKFMSLIEQKSDWMTQNVLSTGEKDEGLAKEEQIKMSPFYVEGDKKIACCNLMISAMSYLPIQ